MHVEFVSPWRIEHLEGGEPVLVPIVGIFTSAGEPEIKMTVDVVDKRAIVTELSLRDADGIASDTLRHYSVAKLVSHVLNKGTLVEREPGKYVARATEEGATAVLLSIKRRERVGSDRLDQVAALHHEGGAHAVAKGLTVSRSQAYRLIKHARDAGALGGGER